MKPSRSLLPAILLSSATTITIAGPIEDCRIAGEVVRDALRAEALRVAFNEPQDWQGVSFYTLPKETRAKVVNDVEELKATVATTTSQLMSDVPGWNRQGYDGAGLARKILQGAYDSTKDTYTIMCLKKLDGAEPTR